MVGLIFCAALVVAVASAWVGSISREPVAQGAPASEISQASGLEPASSIQGPPREVTAIRRSREEYLVSFGSAGALVALAVIVVAWGRVLDTRLKS